MVPAGSAPSQESGGSSPGESGGESGSEGKTYRSKEQLMLRANSLKKALRQIIEQAEKGKRKSAEIRNNISSVFLYSLHYFCLDFLYIKIHCPFLLVVDEQNRHTQVQRMSSSSSIKRENSEELKDAEPRKLALRLWSAETGGEATCSQILFGTFRKRSSLSRTV